MSVVLELSRFQRDCRQSAGQLKLESGDIRDFYIGSLNPSELSQMGIGLSCRLSCRLEG